MKLPILRNFIDNQKPLFVGQGKYSKWFPIFDAIENFIFSSKSKTANPIHVRDSIDIQRVMVIVWPYNHHNPLNINRVPYMYRICCFRFG